MKANAVLSKTGKQLAVNESEHGLVESKAHFYLLTFICCAN